MNDDDESSSFQPEKKKEPKVSLKKQVDEKPQKTKTIIQSNNQVSKQAAVAEIDDFFSDFLTSPAQQPKPTTSFSLNTLTS